ncbi:hypothetical protein AAFG07_12995 [Bradyrhizobium sp. B097]
MEPTLRLARRRSGGGKIDLLRVAFPAKCMRKKWNFSPYAGFLIGAV